MPGEKKLILRRDFNEKAQKIIKDSELEARMKAIYKTDLSLREKIVLNVVEKPLTLFRGIKNAFKMVYNSDLQKAFAKAAGDGTQGFYENVLTGENYTSVGILPLLEQMDKRKLTPGLTPKTWKIAMKAAEQCEDHSPLRAKGIIVPVL